MPRMFSPLPPALVAALSVCLAGAPARALPAYGNQVDRFCSDSGGTPAMPFAGDCSICHNPANSGLDRTEGFQRFRQGDLAYFCPVAPANRPPVLDPIGDRSVSEDGLLAIQVTASDPDGDPLSLEAAGLPTGAVFVDHGDGTAEFAWMPSFDQAGNHRVTFRVTDAGSPPAAASETITISVGNVNRPPVLDPIGNRSVATGELLSFTLSASDPDADALFFASAGLPPTAELTDHGDGTASFRWTPGAGDSGNVTVTFRVTDDGVPMQSDAEEVVISVGMGQNRPPVLDPIGDRSLEAGEALYIVLTASDPDADRLSFSCSDLPLDAGLLDRGDGSAELSWQPAPGQLGNFVLECSVVDAGTPPASDSERFRVTVGSVNRPPVLAPLALMMDGETYVVPLTASDPDGDGLQFRAEGAPAGSDLVDYGDGSGELSYAPGPGESGVFDVLFVVIDDGMPPESDSRVLSLVVDGAAPLEIRKIRWHARRGELRVKGRGAAARALVELRDADSGTLLGTTTANRRGRFRFRLGPADGPAPCSVEAVAGARTSGAVDLARAPARCTTAAPLPRAPELGEREVEEADELGDGREGESEPD